MFESDKAPYFFTLIVALLGWSASRALDRITSGPVLAFEMSQAKHQSGSNDLTVRLENLTSNIVYHDLNFVLTNLDGAGAKFVSADVEYPPPTWPDSAQRPPSTVTDTIAKFGTIARLQPGATVRLRAEHTGSNLPVLRLDAPRDPVRLISGWRPTLIRYELAVLLALIVIWIAMIGVYTRALFSKRTSTSVPVRTTMIAVGLLLSVNATTAAGTITVIDKDTKQPVHCRMFQESGTTRVPVGQTDPKGVFLVRTPGAPGQRYVAVNDAYNNGFADCPVGVTTVYVAKTKFVAEYIDKAKFHSDAGEVGVAALNYKKAADLARATGDPKAPALELAAAQAIAAELNVKAPYAPTSEQRTLKATSEFVDKVADFQRDAGLKASGKLTIGTYEKAAAKDRGASSGGIKGEFIGSNKGKDR